MPPRPRPWLAGAGALIAGLLLSGCHVPGFAVPPPADKQGASAYHLWNGTEFAALAVGGIVWALILFVVVWYRRRRSTPADAIPSQRAYVVWLEIVYTVIPLVIVAVLFGFTLVAQRKLNAVSRHPDLTVQATAFQWGWEFHYPEGNVTTISKGGVPPDLYLPLGETAQVDLTATDVVHAFYVPAFLFQRNAVPGSPTSFDLTPTKVGTYDGKCSTFCGLGHYQMLFTVRVVTPDQFQQWLAGAGAGPGSGVGSGSGSGGSVSTGGGQP
ncbi:MAG TPA: cytochrome c oxidase subunit II [Acidimicrobiales bacterium]